MAADSPSVRRSREPCRRPKDSSEAEEATPATLEILAVPAVLETLATPVTPEKAGPLAVPVHWYNPVAEGNPANQAGPGPRWWPAGPAPPGVPARRTARGGRAREPQVPREPPT